MSIIDPKLYKNFLIINRKGAGHLVCKNTEVNIWFTEEFINVLQDSSKVLRGGQVYYEPV